MLHSSNSSHQEHTTKPRRILKDVAAGCGAVILHYHGLSYLYKEWNGTIWKRSVTMLQSAECGATVVPQWYESL